ncbi:hypothetical protein AKO1_012235 [Acrasis kona]|uniref:Sas10 C-terminal domain-containing protein n=1 Tax=Acrasis kona TaxID=1008807 RepID=A0AAW2Z849_9EUKA
MGKGKSNVSSRKGAPSKSVFQSPLKRRVDKSDDKYIDSENGHIDANKFLTQSDEFQDAKYNDLKRRSGMNEQESDAAILRPLIGEDVSSKKTKKSQKKLNVNDYQEQGLSRDEERQIEQRFNKIDAMNNEQSDDDDVISNSSDSDDDILNRAIGKKKTKQDDEIKKTKRRDFFDEPKDKKSLNKRKLNDKQYEREREDREEEEAEAKEIQERRSKRLTASDFGIDEDLVPAKKSSALSKSSSSPTDEQDESLEKTRNEKLQIILRDAPELVELVADLQEKLEIVREQLLPLVTKVNTRQYATDQGLSYLETKLHLLLTYCQSIMFYLLMKSNGKSVKNHPVIGRLVELRLLMEKIRPIDERMKIQIDKLVSLANRVDVPVSADHRPRIDNLANDEDDEDDEDDDQDDEDEQLDESDQEEEEDEQLDDVQTDAYVPAKLMPVTYDDKSTAKSAKAQRRLEDKVINQPIIKTIKSIYSDEPEELPQIGSNLDLRGSARAKQAKDIEDYENDNFTRVKLTKKEQRKLKQDEENLVDEIREMEKFSDLAALDQFMKSNKTTKQKDRITLMQYSGEADEALQRLQRENDSDQDDDDDDDDAPLNIGRTTSSNHDDDDDEGNGGDDLNDFDSRNEQRMREMGVFGDDDDEEGDDGQDDEGEAHDRVGDKRRRMGTSGSLQDRKRQRQEQDAMLASDERDEQGKRRANDKIVRNKGLMPSRQKDKSNPRVKLRNKYAKKTGGMNKQRTDVGKYSGESNINKGLVRSKRIRS